MLHGGESAALYVPSQRPGALDELTIAAAAHGLLVVEVVRCWVDLARVLADREAQVGLTTSAADLDPDRRPRLYYADELPPTRRPLRWLR